MPEDEKPIDEQPADAKPADEPVPEAVPAANDTPSSDSGASISDPIDPIVVVNEPPVADAPPAPAEDPPTPAEHEPEPTTESGTVGVDAVPEPEPVREAPRDLGRSGDLIDSAREHINKLEHALAVDDTGGAIELMRTLRSIIAELGNFA